MFWNECPKVSNSNYLRNEKDACITIASLLVIEGRNLGAGGVKNPVFSLQRKARHCCEKLLKRTLKKSRSSSNRLKYVDLITEFMWLGQSREHSNRS